MDDDDLDRLFVVKTLKSARESENEHENDVSKGWTYCFRGNRDGRSFKIIVSFEDDSRCNEEMLIINAYEIK